MECPKCKSEMEFATLENMRVDRCLQCQGIWFREGEHKLLRKVKGSELIDIGSEEIGRDFNTAVNVPCPECGGIMDRSADKSQPHIHFEICSAGHGVFFDAGEYRDFKETSIGDLFKRITAAPPGRN
ncbi:MAG: hypothetical protein JWP91_169 [Fibrobacteres bacterium]|nr:hypothetical protein [Fibrobacterota bacterium]